MGLPAGLTWEVRTTGHANNGGAYIDLIPGTSVDYSQQNAAQLSKADLACLLASVTLTSATGGFTAGMVGNVIQIRAGGVNFTAGFYEIVLFTSANSVNLDRTPVAGGNGTGGLGEVGGALISPETFILSGVAGNICYVKSGTYNFTASRTFAAANTQIFGYDTARNIVPTGNNRPLFALAAFFITTNAGDLLKIRNIRVTGSATQLFLNSGAAQDFINCSFVNTNNAGTRYCLYWNAVPAKGSTIMDCEFSGTAGASSNGIFLVGAGFAIGGNWLYMFNFFHDLSYGVVVAGIPHGHTFIKNTFARLTEGLYSPASAPEGEGVIFLFNSCYTSSSFVSTHNRTINLVYGNTFDSAFVAVVDTVVNRMWHIENNDFWNNGASVLNCFLDLDNIGLNPLWVNPVANDFNFGPGSPNIDQALGIRLGV